MFIFMSFFINTITKGSSYTDFLFLFSFYSLLIYNMSMKILCPNCNKPLIKNEKTYSCENNHSFDIAKGDYLNLILANMKKSKNPGDNKEMVDARRDFLQGGYYEKLSDEINKIIYQAKANSILDIGCCEGYYTHRLDKYLVYPHEIIGIDISKDSIRLASHKDDSCMYLVASSKKLPIENSSVDVIINNFAPHNIEEFGRVLKKGGILIKITPAPEHLIGLKQELFDKVSLKPASEILSGFKLISDYILAYDISVEGENILNLLKMTPFYYKSSLNNHEKLKNITKLTTKVAFNIRIYKK